MNKQESDYIEHEIQIRVHEQKFVAIEDKLKTIESKLTWILSLIVGSLLIPLFLRMI